MDLLPDHWFVVRMFLDVRSRICLKRTCRALAAQDRTMRLPRSILAPLLGQEARPGLGKWLHLLEDFVSFVPLPLPGPWRTVAQLQVWNDVPLLKPGCHGLGCLVFTFQDGTQAQFAGICKISTGNYEWRLHVGDRTDGEMLPFAGYEAFAHRFVERVPLMRDHFAVLPSSS